MFLTYKGKGDFISIINGKEAYTINKKYGITKGNVHASIESDMFIIAEKMKS